MLASAKQVQLGASEERVNLLTWSLDFLGRMQVRPLDEDALEVCNNLGLLGAFLKEELEVAYRNHQLASSEVDREKGNAALLTNQALKNVFVGVGFNKHAA